MASLPTVGADNGAWGSELNAYMLIGHDSSGRHSGAYNLLEWGAKGDGVTDDRAAIQAVLDTIRIAGSGVVYAPRPSVSYLINSTSVNPEDGATLAGLWISGNTRIYGAGPGVSIFRWGNLMPNQARIMGNYHIVSKGDEQITLENFGVDGNAANQAQTGTDRQLGVSFSWIRGLRAHNVRVRDIYGTNAGGNGTYGTAGESFGLAAGNSSDIEFVNCEVTATSAATSSGFSTSSSNNVRYLGCWAHDLGIGNGFTHNTVAHVKHVACHSYKNAKYGFNSESAGDITYVGCTGGGKSVAASTYPFASGTSLGNGDSGFVQNGSSSVSYIGCEGIGNTNYGLWAPTNTGPTIVDGGDWSNNGQYGITLSFPSQVRIYGRPNFSGNTSGKLRCPSLTVDPDTTLPTPTVPATTVALTNPYPFPCSVIITGGTVTVIAIDGTATGLTSGTVRVPQGGTITLTYSVAPTWHWWTD